MAPEVPPPRLLRHGREDRLRPRVKPAVGGDCQGAVHHPLGCELGEIGPIRVELPPVGRPAAIGARADRVRWAKKTPPWYGSRSSRVLSCASAVTAASS